MRRLLYWITATALLAAVVHLFVVVVVPGVDTGQKMAQLEAAGEINALHRIALDGSGASLLTEPSPDLAYAFCKFDISERPLLVAGDIPPTYWSVSIYSETGDNFYTLNDRQAGVARISLMVVRRFETFAGEGRPENIIIVRSPTNRGLILFRAFVPDRSQASEIERYLDSSECRPRPVRSAQQ